MIDSLKCSKIEIGRVHFKKILQEIVLIFGWCLLTYVFAKTGSVISSAAKTDCASPEPSYAMAAKSTRGALLPQPWASQRRQKQHAMTCSWNQSGFLLLVNSGQWTRPHCRSKQTVPCPQNQTGLALLPQRSKRSALQELNCAILKIKLGWHCSNNRRNCWRRQIVPCWKQTLPCRTFNIKMGVSKARRRIIWMRIEKWRNISRNSCGSPWFPDIAGTKCMRHAIWSVWTRYRDMPGGRCQAMFLNVFENSNPAFETTVTGTTLNKNKNYCEPYCALTHSSGSVRHVLKTSNKEHGRRRRRFWHKYVPGARHRSDHEAVLQFVHKCEKLEAAPNPPVSDCVRLAC